jgi:hypothetical protein
VTIGLTYDGVLSRVQIALSSIAVDSVRIERSTNELLWETVRGGTEVPISGGTASLDDYEFAPNVENFYRVLDVADDSVEESDSITPAFADCDVWIKSIRYPLLNYLDQRLMGYSDLEIAGRSSVHDVAGRSFPVATTDVNSAFRFELTINTETSAASRRVSLLFALGDVLYLQVAPDGNPQLPPRSMYFVTSGQSIQRFAVGEKRYVRVQAVEVAPPAPEVVGTTLTWQTVWNQYANWTQLWAANPSWSDLLATVGSGEDLVVL